MEKIKVGPLKLTNISENDLLKLLVKKSHDDQVFTVVTPNIAHLYEAKKSERIADALNNADISIPDGWPIARLMSRASGKNLQRITGSDLSIKVLEQANLFGKSIMFVGGSDSSLEKAAQEIAVKYPNLKIHRPSNNPFLPAKPTTESVKVVTEIINKASADIVFFCFGAPKSELHVFEARRYLRSGVILCVGATVDFISGERRRAPQFFQRIRLEWLFRLIQEPRRLFLRYFTGGIAYVKTELHLLFKPNG